jgi:hypothetical protein
MAGAMEVAVDQPLVTFKNILQKRVRVIQEKHQQQPPLWKELSLKQLYGGAFANGIGMSFITGVQMGVIGWVKERLAQGREVETLSASENLLASLVAGGAAAPIASWSEMLMDKYRENVKRYEGEGRQGSRPTYVKATQELWQQHRWRMMTLGLPMTICRDMGFTAAYAAVGPYFAERLKENSTFTSAVTKQNVVPLNMVATIVGSVFAGVLGATITHPFDTRKTQQQGGLKATAVMGKLWRAVLAESYRGFGPRATRVVSAVTLLNMVQWSVEEQLKKYNET